MLKPIPSFIYSKANQISMVLFVPFFALVFINLYRPLDFDRIDDSFLRAFDISREARVQLIALMMVLGGMVIAAASRILMGLYVKRNTMTYIGYIIWIFGELLAMVTTLTLATLLTDTTKTITELFKNSFVKTFLIVFIPYALCYIYFIWQENLRELRSLRKQIERDETVLQKAYIQILDEKGEMRLSIRREHLVLIESADNYVCVHYLNGDKTKKTMVRNTLSRVAEHLKGTGIVRCHRSYMINLEHAKIMHRDKEGVFIELGMEGMPDVPISRTYADNVKEWLSNRD
ncbi:MAG: LytTR family transcriptional regulator [Alistipes sp.]|nr:LytTR family transcriptional regulator [Rikenellaceae bacterium]MBR1962829.1 LytTR family transcriptional regulator [Alistipes sp.]